MTGIAIDRIPVGRPYSAGLLYLSNFPVNSALLPGARLFLNNLAQAASTEGMSRDVFLQHEYLPNGKQVFTQKLQAWTPQSGLGVWPDRPDPELWKTSDLFRMAKGDDVPLMYRVFRLADTKAGAEAWDLLLGTGMVMALVHSGSLDSLLKAYKDVFLPGIKTPNLRIFPFYVPLLDMKSIQDRSAEELRRWLGGTQLYLRESPRDNGTLIVTAGDLEPLLVKSGARQDGASRWIFD